VSGEKVNRKAGLLGEKIIRFIMSLDLDANLPDGISTLNPFAAHFAREAAERFYRIYYNDHRPRRMILGINPGRLGAGATGIPFTDTKRLAEHLGLPSQIQTHEPSSVFFYDMIKAYGGADRFYRDYYITSVCPVGFVRRSPGGSQVNCNYYDREDLLRAVTPFIIRCMKRQLEFGMRSDKVYVLGKRNSRYLTALNDECGWFEAVTVLDHPRYIQQYRSAKRVAYIGDYVAKLRAG
jgi:hypothetical protein